MELHARQTADYAYLDAGNEARLERFGPYVFNRPSPVALWPPERPELWSRADGIYHRSSAGGGHWEFRRKPPASWTIRWDEFQFIVKPTGFGHLGLFPEHTCHWDWLRRQIQRQPGCRILHLFAYTGAMTLVATRAGAEVCHVDAVADINDWARRNADASGLAKAPIRWIADDATKFVAREIRRGRRYDGVILDPPSYGKGPHSEKWIIEQHLAPLLDLLAQAAADAPRFLLFTCHSLGFSPVLMRNLLIPWMERFSGRVESGTMIVSAPPCRRVLPAGFFARWSAE
jgi:23S rRNA (cytosine1962-C5)-methyltransferase